MQVVFVIDGFVKTVKRIREKKLKKERDMQSQGERDHGFTGRMRS